MMKVCGLQGDGCEPQKKECVNMEDSNHHHHHHHTIWHDRELKSMSCITNICQAKE